MDFQYIFTTCISLKSVISTSWRQRAAPGRAGGKIAAKVMQARELEGDWKRAADLERAGHGRGMGGAWAGGQCTMAVHEMVISGSPAMNKHATHKSALPGSFF
ncbi:hypothetical protein [Delftia sp. UME58]|uniref:hypothetical protein n=1 Tax=Delftia sp. UME58 TaxID=1862322 RepID=UPI0016047CC8|nr:hypothetical protein [Delftia sp. UME58]